MGDDDADGQEDDLEMITLMVRRIVEEMMMLRVKRIIEEMTMLRMRRI